MQRSEPGPDPEKPVDKKLPLSPTWEAAAERWIEANTRLKAADHFAGKVFRKEFFPTLARVYFDELVTYTRKKKKVTDARPDIVEELGLHASTLTKWVDESHPPAADKFFAVTLLVLKQNLASIPFSPRRILLFEAVRRQLEAFAGRFPKPPACAMDRTVFRGLLHAMREPAVDKLAPGVKAGRDARVEALAVVVRRVNEGLARDYEAYSLRELRVFDPVRAEGPVVGERRCHRSARVAHPVWAGGGQIRLEFGNRYGRDRAHVARLGRPRLVAHLKCRSHWPLRERPAPVDEHRHPFSSCPVHLVVQLLRN
jgi:hypothetical protein